MNKLDQKVIEILVGLILGDGHIGTSDKKSFITMEQSIKHQEYVISLYNLLQKLGITLLPIKYYERSDKRYGITRSIYFKSHNLECLNYLADLFIVNGIKIIPLNIIDLLTPISLAHWICGDGQQVKGGGITLCTDNYTLKEVELLIHALSEKFKADCSIHYKKGKTGNVYHKIYIKKKSFDSIKPLIREHIHESFLYKLHE